MRSAIANPYSLPERYEAEIRSAAARAIRFARARPPLTYVGMGMTGIVFCDARGRRAWKVPRHPDQPISRKFLEEEADWLRVASTVPSIRTKVARLIRFHERSAIIERECIGGGPERGERVRPWMRKPRESLRELHKRIEKAVEPYGYLAPEFKEDSYVWSPGRGYVLVDASMPSMVGARLVARAVQTLRGQRFFNERPADVAFMVRREAGETIDPERARRLSERLLELPDAERFPPERADPLLGLADALRSQQSVRARDRPPARPARRLLR